MFSQQDPPWGGPNWVPGGLVGGHRGAGGFSMMSFFWHLAPLLTRGGEEPIKGGGPSLFFPGDWAGEARVGGGGEKIAPKTGPPRAEQRARFPRFFFKAIELVR